MNPVPIVNALERLLKGLENHEVKIEKSKLPRLHRDAELNRVQRRLSAKVFNSFYKNYIDSANVKWDENVL